MSEMEEICGGCHRSYGEHIGNQCPNGKSFWIFTAESLSKICGCCGVQLGKHKGPGIHPACPTKQGSYWTEQPTHQWKFGERVMWGKNGWKGTVLKDNHNGSISIKFDDYGYHGSDHHTPFSNELCSIGESLQSTDLNVGDEVEVLHKSGLRAIGIVLRTDSRVAVVLHTDTFPNKGWNLKDDRDAYRVAKELGIPISYNRGWYIFDDESVVTRITKPKQILTVTDEGKEKENMSFVNCATLQQGDRVVVQCKDQRGFTHELEGTVLYYDPNYIETHVFFDQPVPRDLAHTMGNSIAAPSDTAQSVAAVKALGLDSKAAHCYKVGDGGANSGNQYTKITKLLQKASDNKGTGKDNKNMTDKDNKTTPSFGEMFKTDFEKAAWRTGATQTANGVQAGILLMLKEKGGMDESKLAVVKELLGTQIGNALIRSALGYGLTYAPGLKDDPRVKRLSEEFRISGMSTAADEVLGSLFQYLMPAFQTALSNLPPIEEAAPAEVRKALKPRRKRVAHHDENKARVADSKHEEAAIEEQASAEAQAAQA